MLLPSCSASIARHPAASSIPGVLEYTVAVPFLNSSQLNKTSCADTTVNRARALKWLTKVQTCRAKLLPLKGLHEQGIMPLVDLVYGDSCQAVLERYMEKHILNGLLIFY